MKAIVLLNAKAGTMLARQGEPLDEMVAKHLKALSVEADIQMVDGSRLQAAAKTAAQSGVDVVIVGGGDGTLSTVAGVLADTPMPLGILPLGTLNHFAKDLNIPQDLEQACQVIAANRVAAVDVGEVNGRIFINNSSLGVYPHMVLDRETQQNQHGFSKWWAMILAMLKTFRIFPMVKVRMTIDGKTIVRKTPLVFIGNNCYELELAQIGTRSCLNNAELSMYVTHTQSRWGMLKLTWRAIFGGLQQSGEFETYCLSNCLIESRRRRLHVAADGEVFKLAPPLNYKIRPGALRVCLPEQTSVNVTPPFDSPAAISPTAP